ncbi:hypothetical protein JVU11DRAFT_111 [Chiua virens]|nr:hypothetical protein JVU11DRAFT_111 [Chiua virens]
MFVGYDNFGFSHDPILKSLINTAGYLTFESGAIQIVSSRTHFDRTSLIAFLASGLVLLTTIHAQDFADAEGDARVGRCTLPMIAPEWSRVSMLVALPLWSIALSALWGLGLVNGTVFLCLGAFVGSRYFRFRDVKHDEKSYLLYNVFLRRLQVDGIKARYLWVEYDDGDFIVLGVGQHSTIT